ncbi:MAG: hypothetical protein ACFB0B_08890 [Thermonemataceae bacterium]
MKQELKNNWGEVFVQVEYWEKEQILYSNWTSTYLTEEEMQAKAYNKYDSTLVKKSIMGFEEVKRGGALILDKIKIHKTKFLLNDNRQVKGVWDETNDWIASEWMPRIVQAGLLKFAHILSEEFFAQLSAEMMEDDSTTAGGAFEMKLFNDQRMAEEWLLAG